MALPGGPVHGHYPEVALVLILTGEQDAVALPHGVKEEPASLQVCGRVRGGQVREGHRAGRRDAQVREGHRAWRRGASGQGRSQGGAQGSVRSGNVTGRGGRALRSGMAGHTDRELHCSSG